MGNVCRSPTTEDQAERRKNKQIQKIMKAEAKAEQSVTKVLLLGTGESGKSTIFKQARALFGKQFTQSEYEQFRPKVFLNIFLQFKNIITFRRRVGIEYEKDVEALNKAEEFILGVNVKGEALDKTVAQTLKLLWESTAIRKVWERRADFQVFDCIEYYLSDPVLERIVSEGSQYMPTFDDIIQCRDRTTGVVVEKFKMKNAPFEMYDVGGQRSERRKWLACFDNVTTVIFVTAINEYDQKLFEENSVNRIDEALSVWQDIVNRDDFKRVGFVLFLNKWDLFMRKVCEFPFKLEGHDSRNADYMGPNPMDLETNSLAQNQAIDKCAEHIKDKFMNAAEREGRLGVINAHKTNATDQENMQHVFATCEEQILRVSLQNSGFAALSL